MQPLAEAIARFVRLLENAEGAHAPEPRTGVLATADARGWPSARVIVLQGVDEAGFVFITDAESRKGRQLLENPQAALCFYWEEMREQVRIEGQVERVTEEESDYYWSLRGRERQVASWASFQSQPLPDRDTLVRRVHEYHKRFDFGPVPRPPRWVGYRVAPRRIEFWRSGWQRLHEVVCYELTDGEWRITLLNP